MSKNLSTLLRNGNNTNPLPVSLGGTGSTSSTGSGNLVLATSPTLTNATLTNPTMTTPALGTPASGNLANCTGYNYANLSGTAPVSTPDFLLFNLGII